MARMQKRGDKLHQDTLLADRLSQIVETPIAVLWIHFWYDTNILQKIC